MVAMLESLLPRASKNNSNSVSAGWLATGDGKAQRQPVQLFIFIIVSYVIFLTSVGGLLWSPLQGVFEGHRQDTGDVLDINLATQSVQQDGGGCLACLVIVCSLLGACLLVVAFGMFCNDKGMTKVGGAFIASLCLLLPCVHAISTTLRGSREHALIPDDVHVDERFEDTAVHCCCVLFMGVVILTPILFDLGAAFANITGNAVLTLGKLLYRTNCHLRLNANIRIDVDVSMTAIGKDGLANYWQDNRGLCHQIDETTLDEKARKLLESQMKMIPGHKLSTDYALCKVKLQTDDDVRPGTWMEMSVMEGNFFDIRVMSVNPFLFTTEDSRVIRTLDGVQKKGFDVQFRFYDLKKIGFILHKSAEVPSMYFLAPTFVYHILHLLFKLLPVGYTRGGISGFIVIYMLFLNSGALSYIVMGIFGTRLICDEVQTTSQIFRLLSAMFLVLCILPAMPLVLVGMILFAWFYVPMQLLIGLLTRVCFLYCFDQILDWLSDPFNKEDCFVLFISVTLYAFHLPAFSAFPYVDRFANKIQIANLESPLGKTSKCIALFIFVLLMVIEWQFCFNAAVMFLYMNVGYFDALPMAYLSRHWRCNTCLMEAAELHTHELATLAWAQFWSMF